MGPFVVEASGRAHPFGDEDCHISKNLQSPLDRAKPFPPMDRVTVHDILL